MILRMAVVLAFASVACSAFAAGDTDDGAHSAPDAQAPASDGAVADGTSLVDAAPPVGPTLLATSERAIPWVVVDASRVLWMTSLPQGGGTGDLLACAKSGCTGRDVLSAGILGGSLVSDGTTAYVSYAFGSRGVDRIEANGSFTNLGAVGPMNGVFQMVARDGALFLEQFNATSAYSRTIHRLTLASSTLDRIGEYDPSGVVNTSWMAVTNARVFLGAHNTGEIVACSIATCSFADVLTGDQAYVVSMTTDDARVFWADGTALYSCVADVTTCSLRTELAANAGFSGAPVQVLHSGGSLFVQTSGGDLVECDAASCANTVRIIGKEPAFDDSYVVAGHNIAVDESAGYYVARDGADGSYTYRVMRLPRAPR